MEISEFIRLSLLEDVGNGDHTSLACLNSQQYGNVALKIKDKGIIAGIDLAEMIVKQVDASVEFNRFMNDGDHVKIGDIAFAINGPEISLLTAERLLLNCMQRMSGIATLTNQFTEAIKGTRAKILDTRKTSPLNRAIEKWAVKIGGGFNHRFGLFDMILIKDNHIDMCGGIKNALQNTKIYLTEKKLNLKIEIEARSLDDIKLICDLGGIDRILIDNFNPDNLKEAVDYINQKFATEASGGIVIDNVRSYAETGVDFISVGALTHSYKSLDLSLKAVK